MAIENAAVMHAENIGICHEQAQVTQAILPLAMVRTGEQVKVKSISGKDETRLFLSNLGFVEDAEVSMVSELNGNVIVVVKGTRIAISKAMASRVMTAKIH